MKIIRCLSENIEEELHDADKYIDLAMDWKKDDEDAAELFYELSKEEMKHVDMLHEEVARKIQAYIDAEVNPPKSMQELYDWLHKKHIETAMKIRVKQDMFKNQ